MSGLQAIALVLIGLAMLLALHCMVRGPSTADRMVAADALVVAATPLIALIAMLFENAIYLDIALVYGALGFVGVVAMARVLEARQS